LGQSSPKEKQVVKSIVVVCLLLIAWVIPVAPLRAQRATAEASPFTEAERYGEEKERERTFFVFSTSAGKYILRHDGVGEVTSRAGLRKVFSVKVGARERIARVYSWEYGGDLLLLYQAGDAGYLARMNQHSRKVRVVEVSADFAPPVLRDHQLVFSDGAIVTLN
jgi:hypothetical protein